MTAGPDDAPPFNPADFASQTAVHARWNPTWRQRWTAAAISNLYGNPAIVTGAPWNPEQQLLVEERRVITPQDFRAGLVVLPGDARLLQFLDQHPEKIRELTWRRFEGFVAQLLERLGYMVRLGKKGRDGGVDVYAERRSDLGLDLTLVQCKHYREDRKIGEPIIKQFRTEVDDRKATRGLIVTTSSFTSTALKYIESAKYRLAGADYEKLKEWLAQLRGRA